MEKPVQPVGPHLWDLRAVRDLTVVGIALAAIWLVLSFMTVFLPLLTALFLAYLLDPLFRGCETRFSIPRVGSACVVVVGTGLTLLVLANSLIPVLVAQVAELVGDLPSYSRLALEELDEVLPGDLRTGDLERRLAEKVQEIQADPGHYVALLWRGSDSAVSFVKGALEMTTSIAVVFLLIPLYLLFLVPSYPRIVRWFHDLLPHSRREGILEVLDKMDRAVGAYFRGRFLISLIMGAMFSFGWMLTDVPYWFLLGMGTGLLSVIPYAAGVGLPVAWLVKHLEFTEAGLAEILIGPTIVYAVVQFIEGWVLTPWLQGKDLGLHFVTITVVVILGGAAFGMIGMLLAIPLAACAKIFLRDVIGPRWSDWARAH